VHDENVVDARSDLVERGEIAGVAIGGCVILPDNPVWACPDCEHRWT
jgi:hypothetical protein